MSCACDNLQGSNGGGVLMATRPLGDEWLWRRRKVREEEEGGRGEIHGAFELLKAYECKCNHAIGIKCRVILS